MRRRKYEEFEEDNGTMLRYARHDNGGGFVESHAHVAPTAFVGEHAYVDRGAVVGEGARIASGAWIDRAARSSTTEPASAPPRTSPPAR